MRLLWGDSSDAVERVTRLLAWFVVLLPCAILSLAAGVLTAVKTTSAAAGWFVGIGFAVWLTLLGRRYSK